LGKAKAKVTYELTLEGWLLFYSTVTQIFKYGRVGAFPIKKSTTLEQTVDINSYGKDHITIFDNNQS
jgi:hypothetical protein